MATGPEHYRAAERLAEQADKWMDADTGWKAHLSTQERIAHRNADLLAGLLHATLASAAATTLDDEELLAHASAFEIPWPGHHLPLLLVRSYAGGDRWAVCDREGRRWDRDLGWVYEREDLNERTRTDTRFLLAEAWPLAHRIAAGENPVPAPHCDCCAAAGRIGSRGHATTTEHDAECNSVTARATDHDGGSQ